MSNEPKTNTPLLPGKERIDWKVGITPTFDIFIHFQSSDRHFECTMDEETAKEMGEALVKTAEKRSAFDRLQQLDGEDPIVPRLTPMRKPQ